MFLKPYIIAIVDDDDEMRELISEICKKNFSPEELRCEEFANPLLALEFVKKNDVSFLTLDIRMKEAYGDILLSDFVKVRPSLKTVVCSGEEGMTPRMACFLNGADDFLAKPFKEKDLVEVLKRFFIFMEHWKSIIKKK